MGTNIWRWLLIGLLVLLGIASVACLWHATSTSILGKPDFAWPALKVAVFVDGCFWHGCPRCNRPSKSNVKFWRKKVEDNRRRDARVAQSLRRKGWCVLRIWECRVESDAALARIMRVMEERRKS